MTLPSLPILVGSVEALSWYDEGPTWFEEGGAQSFLGLLWSLRVRFHNPMFIRTLPFLCVALIYTHDKSYQYHI